MRYCWDHRKNDKNFNKHGVWFEEAQTVFADGNALEMFDLDHSIGEDRYLILGMSTAPRVLTVVFSEVEDPHGSLETRIISARKATAIEIKNYEKRIRFQ